MAKDYNYDTDSEDDSPEPDGDESPTLEKPQSAQDFPTPVYIAKACQDTIESKESYVLSLYDGIGCIAHDIKDRFNSLGYTKYIALEGDYYQKAMAARSNPESTRTNIVPFGAADVCLGMPARNVGHEEVNRVLGHIGNVFQRYFAWGMDCTPDAMLYSWKHHGSTMKIWGWVKLHHKDCQCLIGTDLAHEPQLEDESQLEKTKSLWGTPHYMNTRDHSYSAGYSLWFTNINLPDGWNVCSSRARLNPDKCLMNGCYIIPNKHDGKD